MRTTRIGLAAYYIAIICLVLVTTVIIIKLTFWSPCSGQDTKCVDGWAVAGLAASIVGIAGAILALLGAFAVAAWWAELDKRVGDQVAKLFDNQQPKLDERVDNLLKEQEIKIKEQLNNLNMQFSSLTSKVQKLDSTLHNIEEHTNDTIELLFDTAMVNPPWELEDWAKQTIDKHKVPGIAQRMVFRYLDYVESLLNDSNAGKISFSTRLNNQNAPTNPLHYWNEAMRWKKTLDDFYLDVLEVQVLSENIALRMPEEQRSVNARIEKIRPIIEAYRNSGWS